MTAKSIIAVEVLQSIFSFRRHRSRCRGISTRLNTSFSFTKFLRFLEQTCPAMLQWFSATTRQAVCSADTCLRIARSFGMNRNYKK